MNMRAVVTYIVLLLCSSAIAMEQIIDSQIKNEILCTGMALAVPDKTYSYIKIRNNIASAAKLIEADRLGKAYATLEVAYNHANTRFWRVVKKGENLVMCFVSAREKEVLLSNKDYCDVALWRFLVEQSGKLHAKANDQTLKQKAAMLVALAAKNLSSAYCQTLILSQNKELAWQADKLHDKLNDQTLADKIVILQSAIQESPQDMRLRQELADLMSEKEQELKVMEEAKK